MVDIVERLKKDAVSRGNNNEAADTIEALRAENARLTEEAMSDYHEGWEEGCAAMKEENAKLREALKPFADEASSVANDLNGGKSNAAPYLITVTLGDLRAASIAIGDVNE